MDRITINGLEVREIRDVQDALAAFQTMNVTAETIVEELAKRAAEYSAIVNSFDRNHSQHGEIIAALSEEQMKLQQLSVIIEKMSTQFQNNIQDTINKAFNRIDDVALHRSMQQTIEKSLNRINIASINQAAVSMNENSNKINLMSYTLSNTLRDIASSIKEYNDVVVHNFNKKALVTTTLVTLLFGLTIGWIIKSELTNSDFINWTVEKDHRYFDENKDANYIRFTQAEAESHGDGFFYVKIKQLHQ